MMKNLYFIILVGILCFWVQPAVAQSECEFRLRSVVDVTIPETVYLDNSRLIYLLDGKLRTTKNANYLDTNTAFELPALTIEEGVHVLEIYLQSGEIINPIGVTAEFVGQTKLTTGQAFDDQKIVVDNSNSNDGCACEQHLDEKPPLTSLWYYQVNDAEGESQLFYSIGGDKNWEVAEATDDKCPTFFIEADGGSIEIGEETFSNFFVISSPKPASGSAGGEGLDLLAFPVPFDQNLTIRSTLTNSSEPARLEVRDVSGRLVYQVQLDPFEAPQNTVLDAENWVAGTYLLRLIQGSQSTSIKVIKTKL